MYRIVDLQILNDDVEGRGFFKSHQPTEWIGKSEAWEDRFAAIYGKDALRFAHTFHLVPENGNPTFVGGTFWNDPKRRKREVVEIHENEAHAAGEGSAFGETKLIGDDRIISTLTVRELRQLLREER